MTALYTEKDKTLIGYLLILSGVLALTCNVIGVLAVNFNMEAFTDPLLLLDMDFVDPLLFDGL